MSSGLYIKQKRNYVGMTFKWLASLAVVAGILTAGLMLYNWFNTGEKPGLIPLPASALADPTVDESPVNLAMINEYKVPATHPRYITIPSLGIDRARVQSVGLTKNNMLDTPKNISDTAWYNKSALPGQGYGQTVIDGHNGGVSRDGVFAKLDKLKKNDEIIIERGDGKKITYYVTENKTELLKDVNETGMKRLMTPYVTSSGGLGLITCAGNWVPREKVFDKRVIVRAVEYKE